jgi:hypothetical protein
MRADPWHTAQSSSSCRWSASSSVSSVKKSNPECGAPSPSMI